MSREDLLIRIEEAMSMGEYDRAHDLQRALVERQNLDLWRKESLNGRMWVTTFPAMKPNEVIFTDSMTGWEPDTDDSTMFKAQQELDRRRNLKLFIHHAKLFCERFPNWTIIPDPNNPFKNVEIKHNSGKYKIESCYPDNALKIWGTNFNQEREDSNFKRRKGIPQGAFRTGPETIPTYTFFGWSIGMDDVPEWAKE